MFKTNTKELLKLMIDNDIYVPHELSKKTGINVEHIQNILSNRSRPTVEDIEKILTALNVYSLFAIKVFFTKEEANHSENSDSPQTVSR